MVGADWTSWIIEYWPLIAFAMAQVAIIWRTYHTLQERVRINMEKIAALESDFDKHISTADSILKEFLLLQKGLLSLQIELKSLIERMGAADEAAIRERQELVGRIEAIGRSITERIDGLFRVLVDRRKGGNW